MKFKTGKQQRKIKPKAVSLPIGRLTKKKRMKNAKGQYQKLKKVIITNFVDILKFTAQF